MILSVVVITYNEEANIGRTLASVQPLVANGKGEIIVVDSGSSDRTVEIAKSFGAKVFVEQWKGYAAQKNSALDKAQGDWILSLDADEEVESDLSKEIAWLFQAMAVWKQRGMPVDTDPISREIRDRGLDDYALDEEDLAGFYIPRKNTFLGRWIRHGGFWPDRKLRLFKRTAGKFEERLVHEDMKIDAPTAKLRSALLHHSYPTLSDYLDHMNRYSSLGAEMITAKGPVRFSVINIVFRPLATFVYNYFFRLGFLDAREGLLLHLYHAVYVSWKYAKAWELGRKTSA